MAKQVHSIQLRLDPVTFRRLKTLSVRKSLPLSTLIRSVLSEYTRATLLNLTETEIEMLDSASRFDEDVY